MRREEIIATLRSHADTLRQEGVAHIALFGSFARDEGGAASDIDLIIEPTPERPITLFTIGPLHDRLSALLGCPVDIIAKSGFEKSSRLKQSAARDLIHVF